VSAIRDFEVGKSFLAESSGLRGTISEVLVDDSSYSVSSSSIVKEGFTVLPYINSDPLIAKRLEEIGCATVMPLGSPIGSAQGIRNAANIAMIIAESRIPIIIDAGIGVPSEAAQALEMGADCVLINSAIALAENPALMAQAFSKATEAGRDAYLSGRLQEKLLATPSSQSEGVISNN